MLSPDDIELIKETHKEIEVNRKEPVTLYRENIVGYDPYTKEPIIQETTEDLEAVVSGFYGTVGGERMIVNGIEIKEGDIKMSLDIEIDLSGVKKVEIDGMSYTVYSVRPRGLGNKNRYEVILRREVQR